MDKEMTNKTIDGCLYVSEDVIAKVITRAAENVDGVAGIATTPTNPLKVLFAKENYGKMKIRLEGDVLSVAVGVILEAGSSAVECAENVQASIKDQVQNVLGLTVARVNVNILDIAV